MTSTSKPKSRAMLAPIGDMDLRLLRVFRAVVDCGGMAAAELELNIGTSTVSRHVKDLETRLGLTLCRRGRAGFALTPEGERRHHPVFDQDFDAETLRGFYRDMVLVRRIDTEATALQRHGELGEGEAVDTVDGRSAQGETTTTRSLMK